jgi:exopolyphosphatase/guanosine-5'-triphosphate,3'-diphosphate pyrophosphatase
LPQRCNRCGFYCERVKLREQCSDASYPHVSLVSNTDDTRTLAAVDLGSNSFHMIVGRFRNGQLQLIDRLREPVRLAAGLTDKHRLAPEAAQRAIACLERFGQRVRDLPPDNVRAVGTNTLRRLQSGAAFLEQAHQALGHGIEVISGIEEARLIHLGVVHSLPDPGGRRLVVDIGGGSTEVIIGEGLEPVELESLYMGCVSMSERFFPDGAIRKTNMKDAVLAARLELQPRKQVFRRLGWSMATGSSGTIRTIQDVVQERGWSDNGISVEALKKLRAALVDIGHAEKIDFMTVSEDRKPVLAGGVAVLSGVFHALKIERMLYSTGALREGLLYDLIGRIQHQDIRESTVQAMAQRYHVDLEQAGRVEKTALLLLDQVADQWGLRLEDARQWLHWSALLHEMGLLIAHSGYHKHGAYLLEHSDLAGFSRRDQRLLAALVRSHRGKFRKSTIEALPSGMRGTGIRLAILLRLAVLLHRNRSHRPPPQVRVTAGTASISLVFPDHWLDDHPLSRTDLSMERKHLKNTGIELEFG